MRIQRILYAALFVSACTVHIERPLAPSSPQDLSGTNDDMPGTNAVDLRIANSDMPAANRDLTTPVDMVTHDAAPQGPCGNGVLDPGEACDDGNNVDGDFCASDCLSKTLCTTDTITVTAGLRSTGLSGDFLPMCNGNGLFGDQSANTITLQNLFTGTVAKTYSVSTPGRFALDEDNVILYATTAAAQLVKIDLANSTQSTITIPASGLDIAWGNNGRVFVTQSDGNLTVVNGVAGTIDKTFTGPYDALIVYDRAHDAVITGQNGGDPNRLTRYAYNATALTLTQSEQNNDCQNGQSLTISPDDTHLAYACGAGNATLYAISDYSPQSFASVAGDWATGAYPRGLGFSRDSTLALATDGENLQLYSASTHTQTWTHDTFISSSGICGYGELTNPRISRGGKIAFAFSTCGFGGTSGELYWQPVP